MGGIWNAIGLVGSAAGIGLLWRAWHGEGRIGIVLLALACWAAATTAWIIAWGGELGVPFAVAGEMALALAFLISRREHRPMREAKERVARTVPQSPRRWHGTARLIVGGPLALVVAFAIATALAGHPAATRDGGAAVVLAGLSIPLWWTAAILWTACDPRVGRQAIAYALITAAGAAIVLRPGA